MITALMAQKEENGKNTEIKKYTPQPNKKTLNSSLKSGLNSL